MVKVLYGRSKPRRQEAYQSLPTAETKPKTKWSCMWNRLPNPTKIFARDANTIGRLGLVYQRLPGYGSGSNPVAADYYHALPAAKQIGLYATIIHILLRHLVPTGLCPIPQEHIQEAIPVGDGGAKHRSMAPPTAWHSVADPHAVATICQGGTQATQTAFASIPAYDPISTIKANYFGKDFLRMAGIVQMLHAHRPPYDKYPYAHPERIRATQQARNQRGLDATP